MEEKKKERMKESLFDRTGREKKGEKWKIASQPRAEPDRRRRRI